jgi:hypothetical protein
MQQIDPWVKAAECERAIRVVADPEHRSVLLSLRSLWIALGNEETIFDTPARSVTLRRLERFPPEPNYPFAVEKSEFEMRQQRGGRKKFRDRNRHPRHREVLLSSKTQS